jgi:hypothetical protein
VIGIEKISQRFTRFLYNNFKVQGLIHSHESNAHHNGILEYKRDMGLEGEFDTFSLHDVVLYTT